MDADIKEKLLALATLAAEDGSFVEEQTANHKSVEGAMIRTLARSLKRLGLAVKELIEKS